ncbi:MAG: DegT/DnrJ/EryC1/StrS family aminotransferase [Pseudomonadota bacterium]
MRTIPQIEPWIDGTELEELTEVVKSTFITENRKTEQFVERVQRITGSPHAIATSNGTLAIVAALLASGIGPGDEVIVPDLTFIASSNAVRLVGAMPVFCDVDKATGCLDITAAEDAVTARTKAIMPVHLYGQMVEMDPLLAMAQARGLVVIEDAAEAFGITYRGRHAGTFGRFGTFSFFANKTITCGEGGVVLCATYEDLAQLYRIKNHGRDRKGIFVHESVGYNFCFTDLQAAVGVAQLRKFDQIMAGKQRVFARYHANLDDLDVVTLVAPPPHVRSNYWFTNILVPDPAALGAYLQEQGIGNRRYFYPLHLQPCYADLGAAPCRNSLWLYEHGLSLPSGSRLSDDDIDHVCEHVRRFFRN